MKAQHLEMVFALRDGRFDDVLAGKAIGGLEVLEHYPDVDMSKVGAGGRGGKAKPSKKDDRAEADSGAEAAPEPAAPAPTISTPPPPPPPAAAEPEQPLQEPTTVRRGSPPAPKRERSKSAVMVAP